MYLNPLETTKETLIATTAYSEISEYSQTNSLIVHLIALEKQAEAKLQISKWEEKTENRTEINEMETKNEQGINEANN